MGCFQTYKNLCVVIYSIKLIMTRRKGVLSILLEHRNLIQLQDELYMNFHN